MAECEVEALEKLVLTCFLTRPAGVLLFMVEGEREGGERRGEEGVPGRKGGDDSMLLEAP